MKHVVITHGYSSRNAGDGLLVDETANLIREAHPDAEITLIAVDPSSFAHYTSRYHPYTGLSETPSRSQFIRALGRRRLARNVRTIVDESDLVVAVGGGYLRASSNLEYLKVALVHRPQLPRKQTRPRVLYMPQSIGPLPPRWLPGFARLKYADSIMVRDNRSRIELGSAGIASARYPDLAVMAIARSAREATTRSCVGSDLKASPTGMVIRTLDKSRSYESGLLTLVQEMKPEGLIQSLGRGNDDRGLTARLGLGSDCRSLLDALRSDRRPQVVVSVRLHGALQSILAGVPSVHLSYERKGWGAFEDLGLGEFVHNARCFNPALVAHQAEQLRRDPSAYWRAVEKSSVYLLSRRDEIIDQLRRSA